MCVCAHYPNTFPYKDFDGRRIKFNSVREILFNGTHTAIQLPTNIEGDTCKQLTGLIGNHVSIEEHLPRFCSSKQREKISRIFVAGTKKSSFFRKNYSAFLFSWRRNPKVPASYVLWTVQRREQQRQPTLALWSSNFFFFGIHKQTLNLLPKNLFG